MEILMGVFFALIIISAIAAAELRDLLAAALALGACGFLVGILFILMMAPDLAIVQFVVEIVTIAVLVIAIARTHRRSSEPESIKTTLALGAIVVCVFLLFSIVAVPLMTAFGSTEYGPERSIASENVYEHYIKEGVEETGSRNLVTGVLLDYRAYDTLGEVVVLFVSILGISAVLRRVSKKMAEGKTCL
jgi:multisubunit Na+/H+ antiporter MnhB subunit